jgi:hypothetical protein
MAIELLIQYQFVIIPLPLPLLYLIGKIMRHIMAHFMELIRWISEDAKEHDRLEGTTRSKQTR